MRIEQYLDVNELTKAIDEGWVERRQHKSLPLSILCYSRKTIHEDNWNDITQKCRGLVVADDGDIVSRPFPKFFNVDTISRPETWVTNLPLTLPQTFEKLDGSLGVYWKYNESEGVASKGSFHSDHADWATAWYNQRCKNSQWPEGYTPVFEMICQAVQKHVVSYDMPDQLILLALINKETGEEADYNTVYHYAYLNGLTTVDIFKKSLGDTLSEDRDNKEGYVLSWPQSGKSPLKVKVKHETFLKLQKIVHNATPKNILNALKAGDYDLVDKWGATTSPELAEFVNKWFTTFAQVYARILTHSKRIADHAIRFETRKEMAEFVLAEERKYLSPVVFNIVDGKDPSKAAWMLVEKLYKEELNRPVLGDPDDDVDKE